MTTTAPTRTISGTTSDDVDKLLSKEWLVTNGLGGYASASLLGVCTRRYHGFFVPDLPLRGRTVMVPRLDVRIDTGSGSVPLTGAEYEEGRLDGEAARCLRAFRREWQVPVWTFERDGTRLDMRVVMPYQQNTVYIHFTLVQGGRLHLQLRPFVTCRMHDAPLSAAPEGPFPLTVLGRRFEIALPGSTQTLKLCLRPHRGLFIADDLISEPVSYRIDRDRGSDHVERLFSPGYFSAAMQEGDSIAMVASAEPWELLEFDGEAILDAERQRLGKLLTQAQAAGDDELISALVLAADQFIVLPGSRIEEAALARAAGDEARTVIAGYHWFGDWGRDTMISLEGLTLCTRRFHQARAILKTFAHYVRDGLIPNMFPEGARTALYHTADATLWYFHALDRYGEAAVDKETLKSLFPILADIIQAHRRGTRFGIGVDIQDGLLHAGEPGYQLTWMDAKVGDWVVTPRRGKPVEIQALWYNALRLMARWAEELGEPFDVWLDLAEQTEASFHKRYWYEEGRYLFDVVDGEQGNDASLRPNQILSLSLRYPILRQDRWRPVVDVVTDKLLTPFGLRSLAPGHRNYKPTYSGDLRARDAAYHQGTVWAWLIGPYIDARLRVYADKREARALLEPFRCHVEEAGLGTISEIFDAEAPYHPRGCIAQAWSVAEVLRAFVKTRQSAEP